MTSNVEQGTGCPNGKSASTHRQDGDAPIVKHRGARLPHWTQSSAVYSVTFRLADAVPQHVLEGWVQERQKLLHAAHNRNRPLDPSELSRLEYLHSERVDAYLNAGHGACWMRDERVARVVAEVLTYFDEDRYDLPAWCIMPNHVHVVVAPRSGHELAKILHSWKSFSGQQMNRLLGRTGTLWQSEYFDRIIRDEEDYWHSVEYVLNNPKKAGLENWIWVGGFEIPPP